MEARWSVEATGRTAALVMVAIASAIVVLLCGVRPARALTLDQNALFSVRLRAYSQVSIATQDSQKFVTDPPKFAGQVMQWRNFANPEFEAKATSLLPDGWLDELSGRLALWGFYDGLYDFGPDQYAQRAAEIKFHINPHGAYQTKGYTRNQALDGDAFARNVRDIYARRIRVNEAYVNIAKGPLFVRIGRQAISWGEADTIGLLDANNPFDTTIAPGIFIDLDEARIPLWTLRATYQLFSTLGPMSSGFIDTYWVPGWLDTTISPLQMQSASPFSAPPGAPANSIEVYQLRPIPKTGNSRWGVRFQTVISDFTTSIWFYKTFPTEPVPVNLGISPTTSRLVTSTESPLIGVAGIATSTYSSVVDAIVRAEVEAFIDQPGFRVNTNITPGLSAECNTPPKNLARCGHYDDINLIRGEIGMDKNVFIRWLNPANSFVWVTAMVFTANPYETKYKDYRASGVLKPTALIRQGKGGAPAGAVTEGCDGGSGGCDFVNNPSFEFFVQSHLESNFLHGQMPAGITAVMSSRGALTIFPDVAYRVTDSFILSARYINIHTFGSENNGFTPGPGVFRDRDEVWFRATYQLN